VVPCRPRQPALALRGRAADEMRACNVTLGTVPNGGHTWLGHTWLEATERRHPLGAERENLQTAAGGGSGHARRPRGHPRQSDAGDRWSRHEQLLDRAERDVSLDHVPVDVDGVAAPQLRRYTRRY